MYMNLPKYSKGFTLLELLISVSIIGILAAGIIPSFNSYIKNQNIRQAQEQIKSDLRSIQNRALTGSSSTKLIGGSTVKYWVARFATNSGQYKYYTSVNQDCSTISDPSPVTATIPNGIVFSGNSDKCLFFSFENGDISNVGESNLYVVISYPDGSVSKKVHFNQAGLIYTYDE